MTPARQPTLAAPPAPPRRVAAVIHRLGGWKLLARLAASRASRVVAVEDLPPDPGAHANVVAGYVCADGRTVVTHLPQAEVEVASFSLPSQFFGANPPPARGASEFLVVRDDGAEFKAEFVGFDASTGLSILQVPSPLLAPAPAGAPPPPPLNEGQRLRLYAPEPLPRPAARTSTPAPPSQTLAGQSGVVYTSMGAVEGLLAEVRRAPTGQAIAATVRAEHLSPERAGAVAFDDSGALLGIVTGAPEGQPARLIPAEAVAGAARRVLARRASAPRPWLGARGDALAAATLEKLLDRGWRQEEAAALLRQRAGVLLTAVAPGTPADKAGLKPGDVVWRVSDQAVSGVEDFAFFLDEAGVGSTLNFTVLRARRNDPLKLAVTLSGAYNPADATRAAEKSALSAVARVAPKIPPRAPLLDGLNFVGLSPKLASRFRARAGLIVVSVKVGSRAEAAGLRPGDVIETVNGKLLDPASAAMPALFETPQALKLGVVRAGQSFTLTVPPAGAK